MGLIPHSIVGQRVCLQKWDAPVFKGDRLWLNEQEFLSLDDLKYALRQATQQRLLLSIFNCCQGLQLAQQFANVASTGVIVMREPVPDKVAQIFLQ